MEEVKVMMISSSKANPPMNQSLSQDITCPTWKLYQNPFYNSNHNQQSNAYYKQFHHHLRFPVSTRKIAASFWDLTFFKPAMETELDFARAQIIELKAELEFERKARKKGEAVNKRLAKELAEERRGREALERICQELAGEVTSDKAEIDRLKREMDEERKMLRMAEVIREERVQMKLAEARILFEEKLLELEGVKQAEKESSQYPLFKIQQHKSPDSVAAAADKLSGKFKFSRDEKSSDESSLYNDNLSSGISLMSIRRKGSSPETENPHIKRGIKGFVEFPRVVKAIGSKSRHWGTKLECQKAQLKILLRHKSPIRSNNMIIS